MEIVDVEKLTEYKILPFDVYDENEELLYTAGEILTNGKLIQLRSMSKIYRIPLKRTLEQEATEEEIEQLEKQERQEELAKSSNDYTAQKEFTEPQISDFQSRETETDRSQSQQVATPVPQENQPDITTPKQDVSGTQPQEHPKVVNQIISFDDIDTRTYAGPINIDSSIDTKSQIKLKLFNSTLQDNIKEISARNIVTNYIEMRDKIIEDIDSQIEKAHLFSELKLLGEYTNCHDLNVAILANAFGKKTGLNTDEVQDLIMGALLHDIGKKYLPKELLTKQGLTLQEKWQLENHTRIGYEVIKKHLKLSDKIANPALQHHEKIDGSGYPNKISAENIDFNSQVIGLCSYFDNLTSNKTEVKIKNVHDAMRYIIEKCTKHYSSDILYSFIYMFSYNDIKSFEDMIM